MAPGEQLYSIFSSNQMKNSSPSDRDVQVICNKVILKRYFKALKRATVGRVSSLKARTHYKRQLLRKCLEFWQDKHLFSRKEWKLNIRAEYHYRFVLWRCCFQHWREYVELSKKTNVIKVKAEHFARRRILNSAILIWKVFLKRKKHWRRKGVCADNKLNSACLRKAWNLWLFHYNNQTLYKEMERSALHCWADCLTAKSFYTWKDAFHVQCQVKNQLQYAQAYYNTQLVLGSLQKWTAYITGRRKQKNINERAYSHRTCQLLYFSFMAWRRCHQRATCVREAEESLQLIAKRAIKRRYLYRLLTYILHRRQKAQKLDMAFDWYTKNQLKHSLTKLRLYVERRKLKSKMAALSKQFFVSKSLSVCFAKWISQCDHRDDLKQYPLSKIAYSYYRAKSLSACVYQWMIFVKNQHSKQKQMHLAELHYNQWLFIRCLNQWQVFTHQSQEVQNLKLLASDFNQTLLWSKYFYTWLKRYNLEKQEAYMLDIALSHHKRMKMRLSFSQWINATATVLRFHAMEERAIEHQTRHMLQTYFQQWRNEHGSAFLIREKSIEASHFHETRLKRKCWHAIQKHYAMRKEIVCKEMIAVRFNNMRIINRTLKYWKIFPCQQRAIEKIANRMYHENNYALYCWTLKCWKDFVKSTKAEKSRLLIAEKHYTKHLQLKMFHGMTNYCEKRWRNRMKNEERAIRAQIKIENKMLRVWFLKWRMRCAEVVATKLKIGIATRYHEELIKKKTFKGWKCYIYFALNLKVMSYRSAKFCIEKLESRYFLIWKKKLYLVKEQQHLRNTSLLWWSFNLQHKVIVAWMSYSSRRREKRNAYRRAMELREELLLEKGVLKWIQYAVGNMERRRHRAFQVQIERNLIVQARVHKYAMHWLRKTHVNRRAKCALTREYSSKCTEITRSLPTIRERLSVMDIPPVKPRAQPRIPACIRAPLSFTRELHVNDETKRTLK